MADYIVPPVPVDPDELAELARDTIRARFPEWEASDANLDEWIIVAMSDLAASVGETATDVLTSIFRSYGQDLIGVPSVAATAATGLVTFTLIDSDGYTIPAGTVIGFPDVEGALTGFQTTGDAVVAPGTSTASGVPVVATEVGSAGSGLSGTAELVDPLDFVLSVVTDAPTEGGSDGEADDVYLNRLRDELRLMAPRPILPEDFAVLAKRVGEVSRALALNGYDPLVNSGTWDPSNSATWEERSVTVVPVDENGAAVSSGARADVAALLDAAREVNFVVSVATPTYTTVNVAFTATSWPEYDPAAVATAASDALASYLSAATWGQPGSQETRAWVREDKVRILEVASILNGVDGVRHVTAITLNGGSSDVTLAGAAPLPTAGTITPTVTASTY